MYLSERANQIRDVINYIKKFKNALCVIHIDDSIIESPLLQNHIHDIALIHEAGLKVIIVPGARNQINKVLDDAKIKWQIKKGFRITDERAMPLIKTAAFDVANLLMNNLAAENLTAVIGNWVKARGKGVLEGTDYGSAGEIDKLKIDAIKQTLDNGFVPIFPCIGWNDLGKPYNISSAELSQQIAIHLKAQKLFFILPDTQISKDEFILPESIAINEEGNIPAMNLSQVDEILRLNGKNIANSDSDIENLNSGIANSDFCIASQNKNIANLNSINENSNSGIANLNSPNENSNSGIANSGAENASKNINIATVNSDKINIANSARLLKLFSLAKDACDKGVERIHILNGSIEGILPCEIFSGIGSGTMIYNSGYGDFRPMLSEDIPAVLSLMKPFVERGILLPRTTESLKCELNNLIVYNVDGGIHGCAALKNYGLANGLVQAEISAVAVDEAYSNMGVGPKIIAYLLEKARSMKIDSVFVLTTQTADWFQKQGFVPDTIDSIPDERKKIWTPERGSKVYRIKF